MIGRHRATSSARNRRWKAGVARSLLAGSVTRSAKRLRSRSSAKAARNAAAKRSCTSSGVPFGAYSPCQVLMSSEGWPASAVVGRSRPGTRCGRVTA